MIRLTLAVLVSLWTYRLLFGRQPFCDRCYFDSSEPGGRFIRFHTCWRKNLPN